MAERRPRVVLVTDPMCSWCFGMTPAFEMLRAAHDDRFEFDFMLAGINTHATQPIGDYGRGRIRRLWQEVSAVTGQRFGSGLPAGEFIYNSSRACLAVHAVRTQVGALPFDFLRTLQARFFVHGEDVGQARVLLEVASALGLDAQAVAAAFDDPAYLETTRSEFETACGYGTQALPNVLLDLGDGLRLVAARTAAVWSNALPLAYR